MSEKIRDFTDLMIWRKAVALGKEVYRLTTRFPGEEKFGLTAQIRRAIARGSLAEVESQLLFAVTLGYLRLEDVTPCRISAGEIHRMSVSLMKKLQKD